MKQQKKLSSEQQQQSLAAEQLQQGSAREFASTEELLRFDAGNTTVPPGISQRLAKSSAGIPRPKTAWWKRLFRS